MGFSPSPVPSSVPPATSRLSEGPGNGVGAGGRPGSGAGGRPGIGASLIEMLAARLFGNRHLAVSGAGARRARGAGVQRGQRRPRATWEQAGPADSPGTPRRVLPGNELPGPEVSFPCCSHGSRVAPKETGPFFSSAPDSSLEELIYSSVCSLKDIIYWLIVVITKC